MPQLSFLVIFLFLLLSFSLSGQTPYQDSLAQTLERTTSPDKRLSTLLLLGKSYWHADAQNTRNYSSQAVALARELENDSARADAYMVLGTSYYLESRFYQADSVYQIGLKLAQEQGYIMLEADLLNFRGLVAWRKGEYDQAIEHFFAARELPGISKSRQAMLTGNIALIYSENGNFDKGLEYYQEVARLHTEAGNTLNLAQTYINMAFGMQNYKQDYEKAIELFGKARQVLGESEAQNRIAVNLYTGLAAVFRFREQNDSALYYLNQAEKLAEKLEDRGAQIGIEYNRGLTLRAQGDLKGAEKALQHSLEMAEQTGILMGKVDALNALTALYQEQQDYQKAFEHAQLFQQFNDSLRSRERGRQLIEMQTKYEAKEKEKENALLREQNRARKSELRQQYTLMLAALVGVVLLLITAGVQFRSNRIKQRKNAQLREQKEEILQINEELNQQKEEILAQRDAIRDQHEKITDSIRYAQTIQQAMLPFENRLESYFKDYFCIYRPQSIVSGDFYWANQVDNQCFLIVMDCTGHGVPGAFMSMIGFAILNETILEKGYTEPHMILERLDQKFRHALEHEHNRISGGMELAVCRMSEPQDGKVNLSFAGAKMPVFLARDGSVERLRGTRRSIGRLRHQRPFEKHDQIVPEGTMLYLISDGFVDQHNEKRERIGSKRAQQKLIELSDLPAAEQEKQLVRFLEEHQGSQEQRDDITLFGVRI